MCFIGVIDVALSNKGSRWGEGVVGTGKRLPVLRMIVWHIKKKDLIGEGIFSLPSVNRRWGKIKGN